MSETHPQSPETYMALALQVQCRAINGLDRAAARERMQQTLRHCHDMVRGATAFLRMFHGVPVRLVVLPEYFLTSYPQGEGIAAWQDLACIAPDGPEYEALANTAQSLGVYLSGNAYELDPAFPDLYFQTSFIIDDAGETVLRYRRLVSMFAATPHDVLDAYLDRHGVEGLFPVVETPLGRLACVASEEILYPEITRAMALRGAEVICHSSSETGSPLMTPKNIAKRARAFENMVYVVSANSAGIADCGLPEHSTDSHSQVVDPTGRVLAEAGHGESMNGQGVVDIDALRAARRRPGMVNMLARQRTDLFAPLYAGTPVHQANGLLQGDEVVVPERAWFVDTQRQVIEDLAKRGII